MRNKSNTGMTLERLAASLISARSTVPALSCMHARNGVLIATNHTDTLFQCPTSLPDGTYDRHVTRLSQSAAFDLAELRAYFGTRHDDGDWTLVDHLGPSCAPFVIPGLVDDLSKVIHACDPKCDRPILRSVRVERDEQGFIEYWSTDGSIMATVMSGCELSENAEMESFCLPYESARFLTRFSKVRCTEGDCFEWNVSMSDDSIVAYETLTGASLICKRMEDDVYPGAFRAIMSGKGREKCFATVGSVRDLLAALEPAKRHRGSIHIAYDGSAEITDDRLETIKVSGLPIDVYADLASRGSIIMGAQNFFSALKAASGQLVAFADSTTIKFTDSGHVRPLMQCTMLKTR